MILALLLTAVVLLVLPGATRRIGHRLRPLEWVVTSSLAMVGAVVAFHVALLVVLTECRGLGASQAQQSAVASVSLGVLAVVDVRVFAAVSRAVRVNRLARVEADLGEHWPTQGGELVLLPSSERLALSVAGRPPQVVVTQGLVDALDQGELRAVLRHERAHLEHSHHRYLFLAAGIEAGFGAIPLVRRSTDGLRLAVERWADEEAAGPSGVGRLVLRSALLAVSGASVGPDLAAFSSLDGLVERLDALERPLRPPPVRRLVLHSLTASLALVAIGGLVAWAADAHVMATIAGLCLP